MAIHDPCFYGRYLDFSEVPRKVLRSLGSSYVEVAGCGAFTSCCGGPAESVSPALTREILEGTSGRAPGAGGAAW